MMVYRIPEDKSEIIERNNEVKKDLMITTKSLENSNFMPVTKSSNSTLGVRTTLRNAKRKVKNLGNKGGAKFKAYFGQKNTVEQVSKHQQPLPIPPQMLMSIIMGHNRYINGFALLFKVIVASLYL